VARGHQRLGEAAHLQVLERAGVHGERPGEVGAFGALLQDPDLQPRFREVSREQQPGRAGAYHHDVGIGHAVSSLSRSRRPIRAPASRAGWSNGTTV
jgi:hypothetical protein